MATILTQSIIDRAGVILLDAGKVRWPSNEMILWLNDGQREAAIFKPNIYVLNTNVSLVAGTKQALPAEANSLVEIVRNMGAGGLVPGRPIRIATRESLDSQIPDWHAAQAATTVVKHFIYSPLDPKNYYVYPASPGGVMVEAVFNASPPDATIGGVITLDDIYSSALLNFVLYRAYAKDTEFAANAATSDKYYQSFLTILRGKAGGEVAADPNALG